MNEFNARRGFESIEEVYSDLGSVFASCHKVLSMAPDTKKSPEALESWNKIKEGVITIMMNSQETSKNMFDAAMKIKVVNNSIETMEN
jgi:hypothetical protein